MVSRIREFLQPTAEMRRAADELREKIADADCRHEENERAICQTNEDIKQIKHEASDHRWRKGA